MSNLSSIETVYSLTLNNKDFKQLATFIEEESGIKMPDHKKVLVQGRLKKRIHQLGLKSFTEYCNFLFDPKNKKDEILQLLSFISTNKTEFFREPLHFSFIKSRIIPELISSRSEFNIWSAGCSSGQEAYTTAMVMEELKSQYPQLRYRIQGTDISMRVLTEATRAEYTMDKLNAIPQAYLKKYFLRHKDKSVNKVRIAPEIRQNVKFSYLNFMEPEFSIHQMFDIIFLRNVLIYFHKEVQKQVINKVIKQLKPDGYLFLGHSESIFGYNLKLESVGPNMYKKIVDK